MSNRQTIAVTALMEASGIRKGVDESNRHLNRLGKTTRSLSRLLKGGIVGVAGAVAFSGLIQGAGDAQQSIGATETVYGKYADKVIAKSNAAGKAIGLSANSYRELSNVSGSMLKSTGTPLAKLAGLTDKLNVRAADLAATYGGTTKEAVEAVGSLLRGESDPIERYGVSIKQSDVNARLAAQGLTKLTGEAKKQAEQQARLSLLFKQSSAAQGQFSRESNTLQGQTQRSRAGFTNLRDTIGSALLPGLTTLAAGLNTNVLPAMQTLAEKYAPLLETKFQSLATAAGPKLGDTIDRIGAGIQSIGKGDTSSLNATAGNLQTLAGGLKDAAAALPSFSDLLTVSNTVLGFAADNVDLLAKAMPFLVAGYVAVKTAQLAANAAAVLSVPTKIAEVVVNRQLVKSNQALIASRAGVTATTVAGVAAETAGTASRSRGVVATVAATSATVAYGVASKAAAAGQWLLNAAMTANPLGLVIVGLVALGAGLVLLYKKSETFRNIVHKAFGGVRAAGAAMRSGLTSVFNGVGKVIGVAGKLGKLYLTPYIVGFKLVTAGGKAMLSAVTGAVGKVTSTIGNLKGKAQSAAAGARGWLKSAGVNVVHGIVDGIKSAPHLLADAIGGVGDYIKRKIKEKLKINSPAKTMIPLGASVTEGLAVGMTTSGAKSKITAAASRVVATVSGHTFRALARLNKAASDKTDKLTKEQQGRLRTLATRVTKGAGSLSIAGINRMLGTLTSIKKQASNLSKGAVASIDKAIRRLNQVKGAKQLIADAVKARNEYAKSVRDAARQYAGLATLELGENQTLSAASIKQHLVDRLAAITNFKTKLAALAKKGLSSDLIAQITGMGVEQGGAYAAALADQSPKALAELNKLQSQIDTATSRLGTQQGNQMYKAGLDIASGLVKGIKSKKLTSAASGLARDLVKAVKKELGIKSPSRVFAKLGRQTIDGLDQGLDARRVERAGARVSTALQRGYVSPEFDAKFAAGFKLSAAKTGDVTNVFHVNITLDPHLTKAEQGRKVWDAIKAAQQIGMVPKNG